VNDSAVADSACLIVLDQIGRIDLLTEVFSPVFIPPAVESELPHALAGIQVQAVRNASVTAVLNTQVDAGEAEVIALAREMENPWVLLDDKKARRVAQQLGLRVIGTVGLLLRAKAGGLVADVKPSLNSAVEAGFYISPPLYREALRLAGEE
jgi:uncharacterized protein